MIVRIKLHIINDNLIDVINCLDQKNVSIEFNKQELFRKLIDGKKVDEIYFFLDRGFDIDDFLNLCTEEDIEVINFLVDRIVDDTENLGDILVNMINKCNYKHINILFRAYKNKREDVWNYLDGLPLRLAVRIGNKQIIKLLLSAGAKIRKCDIDPIIDALITGKPDLIPLLLENGSNISNIKPEHLEICLNKKFRLCTNFIYDKLHNGMLPHFQNADVSKCFVFALKNNYDQLAKALMEYGIVYYNDNYLLDYIKNPKNMKILQYHDIINKIKHKYSKKYGVSDEINSHNNGVVVISSDDNNDDDNDDDDNDDDDDDNDDNDSSDENDNNVNVVISSDDDNDNDLISSDDDNDNDLISSDDDSDDNDILISDDENDENDDNNNKKTHPKKRDKSIIFAGY
jgi:hypothetical protein